MKDPCKEATKTITLPWTDFNYDLNEGTVTKTWSDAAVTSTESICGVWIYSITKSDLTTAIDAAVFSVSGLNFNTASTDTAKIGEHPMIFKAWQGTYTGVALQAPFKVTIADSCSTATLTPSSLVDQTYTLSKTQIDLTFAAFGFTPSYCPFVYTHSTDADANLVSFDDTLKKVSIYHANPITYKGVFTVTVTATYGTNIESFSFKLTTLDPCEEATKVYTGTEIADFTYDLNEGTVTKTWTAPEITSTETDTLCGAWSYSITKSDLTAIDAAVFTVTGLSLVTTSTDTAKVGTHPMSFKAWQGSYTGFAVDTAFTVTITDSCDTTTVTPSSLADQTYLLSKAQIDLTFAAFTFTPAYCPFVYTAVTDADANLVSFDMSTKSIAIHSADPALYEGVFTVTVTATYGTNTPSFSF